MNLAIIGSRSFDDYDRLCQAVNDLPIKPATIVSGGAKGADAFAERYANEHQIDLVVYRPDYARYKRGATLIRNRQIVENADTVLAFWDGVSKGTKYTLDYANKKGKIVIVCQYAPPR